MGIPKCIRNIVLMAVLAVTVAQTVDKNYLCNQVTWGTYNAYPWDNTADMTITKAADNQFKRSSKIVHWYGNWDDGTGDFVNSWNQPKWLGWATNFTSYGSADHIPMVTWQPWASPYGKTNNYYAMSKVANGDFDTYITNQAVGLKNYGKVIYIRPIHEFDGDWYPWGSQNTTPAQFIAAWRRIKDIFSNAGATNVKFVWCPNHANSQGIDQTAFFPGDSYIDFACMDVYSDYPSVSFADSVGKNANPVNPYDRITKITAKPIIIAEFGVKIGGQNRSTWFQQMALDLPTKLPQIKALVFFNSGDYKIPTSETATNQAIQAAFGECSSVPSSTSSTSTSNSPVNLSSQISIVAGSTDAIAGSNFASITSYSACLVLVAIAFVF